MRASALLHVTAVLFLCAALPPAALAAIIANAAGTLFETTPLLLGAEVLGKLLARPRAAQRLAALLGCGCGSLPGALSIPAAILCTLTFGPLVAEIRWLVGLTLATTSPHPPRSQAHARSSALDQLISVALLAFAGATLTVLRQSGAFGMGSLPPPLLFMLGICLGLFTPCTVGAVALAANMRGFDYPIAAGILWSSGFFPAFRVSPKQCAKSVDRRTVYLLIAIAGSIVTARGGAALIHPKLVPLVAWGSLLALVQTFSPLAPLRRAALIPAALMLIAPILKAPPPPYDARETTIENIFLGQRLTFMGEVVNHRTSSTLVRYAVTCCRADAAPIALRLDRRLAERTGMWAEVEGTVRRDSEGALLQIHHSRAVLQPGDPFLYR